MFRNTSDNFNFKNKKFPLYKTKKEIIVFLLSMFSENSSDYF
jgi:hypothetical protein